MKRIRYWLVVGVTLIAAAVFGITLIHALWYAPQEEAAAPPQQLLTANQEGSPPVRLSIPRLTIDANVQKVGVTKAGAMGVPNNFTDVAWYKYGTTPGQVGSAVIDGHVDNGLSLAGVFKHLSDIKAGDDIYVETASSTKLHFVVQDVELYPYKEVPLEKVFNQNDAARLNLITCDGAWVAGEKTYDHRLVVYATLAAQ